MAEMPKAEVMIYAGSPTLLRPDEGDDNCLVLGLDKTLPETRDSGQAVIQVRRIGWITPDGKTWSDVPPWRKDEAVPIFVPLAPHATG